MNRKEINLSDMLQSVDQFLNKNVTQFQNQTALMLSHTQLHVINGEIFSLSQLQAVDTTVDTKLKGNQKTELIQVVMKVSAVLIAHAAATDNTKLKLSAGASEWELKNMRENDLVIKAKAIYDLALPLLDKLIPWGITQADLDLLGTDYAEFKQKTPENRNQRAQSTQATATLKEKLHEGKTLVKEKIDPMMLTFKALNPSFYAEFVVASTIVDRAAGHGSKGTGSGELPIGDDK